MILQVEQVSKHLSTGLVQYSSFKVELGDCIFMSKGNEKSNDLHYIHMKAFKSEHKYFI